VSVSLTEDKQFAILDKYCYHLLNDLDPDAANGVKQTTENGISCYTSGSAHAQVKLVQLLSQIQEKIV
jgi:hypothetical protein